MLYDGTLIFLVVAVFRVVVVVGTGGKRGGFSWWEGKENVIIHIDAVQCIIRFPCPPDSFVFFFVVVVISSDRLRKIKKGETDIETYQAAHILGCIMSRSG